MISNSSFSRIALIVALSLCLAGQNRARALDKAEAGETLPPQAAASAPRDSALSSEKTLEGHIKDEAVALEEGIKDLVKTLHHLKRSAWDVFCEAQRQEMAVVAEPDVIGPIIIPAIPSPSGMLPIGGFLPPRKKFLDYFMDQIADLLKMTQKDVSGLVLTDDASDEARQQMKTVADSMAAIPGDVATLKDVTAGPNYDNMAIARQAQILQDRIVMMEKACKKINSEMKREESQKKKELKEIDRAIKKQSGSK